MQRFTQHAAATVATTLLAVGDAHSHFPVNNHAVKMGGKTSEKKKRRFNQCEKDAARAAKGHGPHQEQKRF
jgi:hypothetical protein